MKGSLNPPKVLIFSLIFAIVQFGLAMILLGGWTTFFSRPALVALTIATVGLIVGRTPQQREPKLR
jgi:hypothetical protein